MMITPRKEDAFHKIQLYRLLIAVIDTAEISSNLCFKGGTCAALLDRLDRFSLDLDFDLLPGTDRKALKRRFHTLFQSLHLEIKDESKKTLLFILKYDAPEGQRNTIKLDAVDESIESSIGTPQYLSDVDRYMNCQTIETMFAHKLVAIVDRYEKNNTIAGRDMYDIHHFFQKGYAYSHAVIKDRRKTDVSHFINTLIAFVETNVTQRILDQDLNMLLPDTHFQQIRKGLKQETLVLLKDELQRLSQ
jgi:predicted nucleotidyltransferase component of viral defense system